MWPHQYRGLKSLSITGKNLFPVLRTAWSVLQTDCYQFCMSSASVKTFDDAYLSVSHAHLVDDQKVNLLRKLTSSSPLAEAADEFSLTSNGILNVAVARAIIFLDLRWLRMVVIVCVLPVVPLAFQQRS